jgi:predicted  nucleic acid-binding Zn-ribbon protein
MQQRSKGIILEVMASMDSINSEVGELADQLASAKKKKMKKLDKKNKELNDKKHEMEGKIKDREKELVQMTKDQQANDERLSAALGKIEDGLNNAKATASAA